MLNYVTTVLVSNLNSDSNLLSAAPANASALNTPSSDAGKFIIMNCDANVASNKLYEVTAANAANINTIKVGIVTKKNLALRMPNGSTVYQPIVKWSNQIKAADIKSFNSLSYAADTEDTVVIDLSSCSEIGSGKILSSAGKRVIVKLTYKDMPHRYRKWTESYEYTTSAGETATTMATGIANMINKEWKRARVSASAASGVLTLVALPYDDDDAVDTLNVANKVRFNANMYWTDPQADGWESKNKHFPAGATITKTPGKTYPASAKLVRDREAWAMGYLGILNRGEGTWPIIKPDMETELDKHYNAITLEFENMYRAADDIQRKTKQVLEVYSVKTSALQAVLDAFVNGMISSADSTQTSGISANAAAIEALSNRVSGIVTENSLNEPANP